MSSKTDECIELKNIQYKSMLSGGNIIIDSTNVSDFNSLDKFLEDNNLQNLNENWAKIDHNTKYKKLINFAKKYVEANHLDEDALNTLTAFLKESLDNKQLQRVKDVTYDKATKEIKDIPPLTYNEDTKTFHLKIDKNRIHTLKSLPPSKNSTMKHKLI
jgi:hypothetical protein